MIQQEFEFVAEADKFGRLVRLLEREMDGSRLLVFCETKRGCDAVTRQLRQNGWPALSIHGDKSQEERDWVLSVRGTGPSRRSLDKRHELLGPLACTCTWMSAVRARPCCIRQAPASAAVTCMIRVFR